MLITVLSYEFLLKHFGYLLLENCTDTQLKIKCRCVEEEDLPEDILHAPTYILCYDDNGDSDLDGWPDDDRYACPVIGSASR